MTGNTSTPDPRVRRLVIAARALAYPDLHTAEDKAALDQALEAFADVEWEDE